MTRTIPQSVVNQALWWLSAPPVQAHPRLTTGPVRRNSWTGKSKTRKVRTQARVSIGAACRYALYAWSGAWTEADLAEAVAELTRRIDDAQASKKRLKRRDRAQQTAQLSRLLRGYRRQQDPDIEARVARYLKRHPEMPDTPPAYEAEIRARVYAPRSSPQPVFRDDQWWASETAYQTAQTTRAAQVTRDAVRPAVIVLRPSAAPASRRVRGVSMGELARVAAEVNGRRV